MSFLLCSFSEIGSPLRNSFNVKAGHSSLPPIYFSIKICQRHKLVSSQGSSEYAPGPGHLHCTVVSQYTWQLFKHLTPLSIFLLILLFSSCQFCLLLAQWTTLCLSCSYVVGILKCFPQMLPGRPLYPKVVKQRDISVLVSQGIIRVMWVTTPTVNTELRKKEWQENEQKCYSKLLPNFSSHFLY